MKETKTKCSGKEFSKTKCAGKVKVYSSDLDIENICLCDRHWTELMYNSMEKIGKEIKNEKAKIP